jgi:hypothetical protein
MSLVDKQLVLLKKMLLFHRPEYAIEDRKTTMWHLEEIELSNMSIGQKIRQLDAVARYLRVPGIDYARVIEELVRVQAAIAAIKDEHGVRWH